ncbi:hypothetical protein Pmani_034913 [Petrolisthes manimaculis]|uniref:Uncharacterized protein n=1 Tax=Petrolisthes manimaculis TaxID=1843537 RepID=A0AAE1NMR7_9EUCA|nr:hypothetical protein Pmani_034913 [Petrolisthes manimaculis]
MGQAEFEEEAPSKQDLDQQDHIVDVTNKAPHAGGGGGAFFIKVEEVSNQTPHKKQQLRPKAPTPDSGVERSKWLRRPRRGFSLFNFKRKGHDDAKTTTPREVNGQVAREGKDQHMWAQLHPQPGVLTDVEVQVLSQPHTQPFGALTDFEDGATDPARLFQPAARAVEVPAIGSLVPLSPNINLVSDPATDTASLQLQEITTLYTLLNTREKGQGDFTSVSFELEELENKNVNDTSVLQMNENTDILQGNYTNNNSNVSQPGTQERKVLPQILQPLNRNGGRPPTRDGKTLFVTSDRRPVQLVNGVKKEAIQVTKPELESWMSNLPPSLQRLPLNHIYIPG